MMFKQEFYMFKYDWFVEVIYVVDSIMLDYVALELESFGCRGDDLEEALHNLEGESGNKGLTYSNLENHTSIIVIGETSCPAEFQHTFDHEKLHLAMHISKVCDIDPYSEELAYLVGDIGLRMFPIAKKFLCEHCREAIE